MGKRVLRATQVNTQFVGLFVPRPRAADSNLVRAVPLSESGGFDRADGGIAKGVGPAMECLTTGSANLSPSGETSTISGDSSRAGVAESCTTVFAEIYSSVREPKMCSRAL